MGLTTGTVEGDEHQVELDCAEWWFGVATRMIDWECVEADRVEMKWN